MQLVSERALGKRPRPEATTKVQDLIALDGEDEIPLPGNIHVQGESSTQRRSSGRLPKRPRRDEDFVYEKP